MAAPTSVSPIYDTIETTSSIEKLPFEITVYIFHLCDSTFDSRLKLTHVCRQWRTITLQVPSLWTNVHMMLYSKFRVEKYMARLNLQLGLTGDLPLDVFLEGTVTACYDGQISAFLHIRAPFSRWRSLKLRLEGYILEGVSEDGLFQSQDIFSVLESLTLIDSIPPSILLTIDSMTTDKMKYLNMASAPKNAFPAKILGHVSHLVLGKSHSAPSTIPSLPSNITHVHGTVRSLHSFPHILTYNPQSCYFILSGECDLRSLVSLTASLIVASNICRISLPSLQHLNYGRIRFLGGGMIEAPILKTLRITTEVPEFRSDSKTAAEVISDALHHPGNLLYPRESLQVDISLSATVILFLLEKSPLVEKVTLTFEDTSCANLVLSGLSGEARATDMAVGSSATTLCHRLSELRLNFAWGISEVDEWKERALGVVKARGSVAYTRASTIYAAWKGEGTYVLLADGRVA